MTLAPRRKKTRHSVVNVTVKNAPRLMNDLTSKFENGSATGKDFRIALSVVFGTWKQVPETEDDQRFLNALKAAVMKLLDKENITGEEKRVCSRFAEKYLRLCRKQKAEKEKK